MNKLTKLMLASAMMITSGFAAENFVVDGTINHNVDRELNVKLLVNAGATFNNFNTLTLKSGGGIVVCGAVVAKTREELRDYNETYGLGVLGVYGDVIELKSDSYTNSSGTSVDSNSVGLSLWDWLGDDFSYGSHFDDKLMYVCTCTDLKGDLDQFVTSDSIKLGNTGETFTAEGGFKLWKTSEFEANVRKAASGKAVGGDYTEDIKRAICSESKAAGKFDNSEGIIDLTGATGSGFSGEIQGGTLKMSEDTSADLSGLKLTEADVEYCYDKKAVLVPFLDENKYITVNEELGKSAADAEDECKKRFANGSGITYVDKGEGEMTDNRKDFPGILDDTDLNKTENKMLSGMVSSVVKNYDAGKGLNVTGAIEFQFEGETALKFATGMTVGSDQVIGFYGDNSLYTGEASFATEITKVVAVGDNALPSNLTSAMENIVLEIRSGANEVTSEEVTVSDVIISSGAKFTVAAGTVLNIGEFVVKE